MLAVRSRIAVFLAMTTPGVGAACPISAWNDSKLQVVPANGGVFLDDQYLPRWCELSLRPLGSSRALSVPLARVDDPGLYWPTRQLTPRVRYELVSESEGCSRHGVRVLAVEWRDDEAPRWRGPPGVEKASYHASCGRDDAQLDLIVPVSDESPVRIHVEARSLFDIAKTTPAVEVLRDPCVIVRWRIWPDAPLEPGMPYVATVCAEDAAGNRSCAPKPIFFLAPRPILELTEVGPEEPMQQAALLRDGADWPRVWRNGKWIGLALVCLVIVALGRARLRRAIRAV